MEIISDVSVISHHHPILQWGEVCTAKKKNKILPSPYITAIDVHISLQVRHTGTNPHRTPLKSASQALLSAGRSGTMTSILLDISVEIRIFF